MNRQQRNRSHRRRLAAPPRYDLLDRFHLARAQGSVDSTLAEPGPGSRTVIADTDTAIAIAAGVLDVDGGADNWTGTRFRHDQTITRVPGLTLALTLEKKANRSACIGLANTNAPAQVTAWEAGLRLSGSNIQIAAGTDEGIPYFAAAINTVYHLMITLRATGAFFFVKGGIFTTWTLFAIADQANTATLYFALTAYQSDGHFHLDHVRLLQELLAHLARPISSDDFNASNGALGLTRGGGSPEDGGTGKPWTAATWTINTNKAANTPTVINDERVRNIGFEGTYDDEGGGIMLATNWNGYSLDAGTDTATKEESHIHGGAAAQKVTANARFEGVYNNTLALTVGNWYLVTIWVDTTATVYMHELSGNAQIDPNPLLPDTSGAYVQFIATFRATHTGFSLAILLNQDGAATMYYDDASVKPLTLSTLFATLQHVTPDVLATVDLTVTHGTQAGLALCVDDPANPANFVIAIHDGANARLIKCVAGTYTSVISAAATYQAGAPLRVIKLGTTWRLHYNRAAVGSVSTISDAGIIDNTHHGLFSTYNPNRFENLRIFPAGIEGQYAELDNYP